MIRLVECVELLDELRAFWRSPMAARYVAGWNESRIKVTGVPERMDLALSERHVTERASLYWVKDEMRALAEYAAARMPRQALVESDLPTPFGFAMFERPVVIMDVRDKALNIGAISWQLIAFTDQPEKVGVVRRFETDADMAGITRAGVEVAFYSDESEPGAYEVPSNFTALPRLLFLHHEEYGFDRPVVTDEMLATLVRPLDLPPPNEETLASFRLQRQFPLALWTLIQQPLSVVTEAAPHRTVARRLERKGSPLAHSTIRIVTLRRVVHRAAEGEAGGVEWSHRWLVSGHWRNQWLPSRSLHRLQWIDAFVKGPADKPLVVKKTVHKLVR